MRPLFQLALACLLFTSTARAEDERAEARAHSEIARIAFKRGDYRGALEEFRKAYDAAPVPELLFNVGSCLDRLGQRREAAVAFRKYLAARPDAEDRAEVTARIADLEHSTAAPTIAPATAGPTRAPAPTAARGLTPAPTTTSAATAATTPLDTLAPPAAALPAQTPLYRRAWPWAVGAVLVVGAVAASVAVATAGKASDFPAVVVR